MRLNVISMLDAQIVPPSVYSEFGLDPAYYYSWVGDLGTTSGKGMDFLLGQKFLVHLPFSHHFQSHLAHLINLLLTGTILQHLRHSESQDRVRYNCLLKPYHISYIVTSMYFFGLRTQW